MRIAFFDTKKYDKKWFDQLKRDQDEIVYFESRLNAKNYFLVKGFEVVIAFVNDEINDKVINGMVDLGVKLLAMRSAGYNNVDIKCANERGLKVVRVPAYSPYAVAEHAMALILASVRKINHSYVRTREFNFSLNGLVGFDLHQKTIGVVGTGKIGKVFIQICKGFSMKVLAYDPYPSKDLDVEYVDFKTLCRKSDIISFHCPLTKDTRHLVNKETIEIMKDGVVIVNTSRGALVDAEALLQGIRSRKVGSAALDVYEEEAGLFFEDQSEAVLDDDTLMLLISMPNVIVTSHQAFLTEEALKNIAQTTIDNIIAFENGEKLVNLV
ncbi:MAG: 2-hydroxyacid dehydrogenase [Sphaerochaetaceae bacterium]|nr:2-hydroxyacid dehydrogenase [Sphaerochaetaceae bacterium]MDC7236433.1 2-hydroxyacid dehydrogenase [Sphaerochaetaceae bacterium]MDC7243561.1 2-hydroxyacid dehydrogenase [Sphaerochaetaceae bacterium]